MNTSEDPLTGPVLSAAEEEILRGLTVPIPDDEAYRLNVLRETNLLDSTQSDPDFDRYTSLAKRIFNVPIALISFVDIDRQWFKSKFGLEADQTHRNYAFCSYTVLPESPEVFVVADALADDRFKDNPLVTGSPHIRFYAGAALMVDGTRVGSLCVIDTVPRPKFTLQDRMNLMDIGQAASVLIAERKRGIKHAENERGLMMLNLAHNLRTPLMSANIAASLLSHCGDTIIKAASRDGASKEVLGAATNFKMSMEELTTSLSRVQEVMDTFVVVSELVAENEVIQTKMQQSLHNGVLLSSFNAHVTGEPAPVTEVRAGVISTVKDSRSNAISPLPNRGTVSSHPSVTDLTQHEPTERFRRNRVHIDQLLKEVSMRKGSVSPLPGQRKTKEVASSNTSVTSGGSSIGSAAIEFNLDRAICEVMDEVRESFKNQKTEITYEVKHLIESASYTSYPDSIANILKLTVNQLVKSYGNIALRVSFVVNVPVDADSDCPMCDLGQPRVTGALLFEVTVTEPKQSSVATIAESRAASAKSQSNSSKLQSFKSTTSFRAPSAIGQPSAVDDAPAASAYFAIRRSLELVDRLIVECRGESRLFVLDDSLETVEIGIRIPAILNNLALIRTVSHITVPADKSSEVGSSKTLGPSVSSKSAGPTLSSKLREVPKEVAVKPAPSASAQSTAQPTTQPPAAPAESSKEQTRALVVDDSLPIQKGMKRLLEMRGCVVDIAVNGKAGLDLIQANKYDICFLDFLMPVMSGLEMMKAYWDWRAEIKGDSSKRDLNERMLIWGMSATAVSAEQREGIRLGMHLFGAKPLHNDTIGLVLKTRLTTGSVEEWVRQVIAEADPAKSGLKHYLEPESAPGTSPAANTPAVSPWDTTPGGSPRRDPNPVL